MTSMPTVGLSARGSQAAIVEELENGSERFAHEHKQRKKDSESSRTVSLAACT